MKRIWSLLLACAAIAAGPALAAPPPATTANPAALVGRYDVGQMEMAAGLELGADGRFEYGLAYGALDEAAAGRWEAGEGRVLLTSDPVAAPRFVLLSAGALAQGRLRVTLDLPAGMNRQYFKARVRLADGRSFERQFADDGLDVALEPGERVVSVALLLPVFGLEGEAAALPGAPGGTAHFRFEPHDLGKVAFAGEALRIEDAGLVMERHGRRIVFRRVREAAP